MNRSVLLGGILLVLVPGIWALRGLEREGSIREIVDRDFRSKSARARRGVISPTEARRKLRELHGLGKANTSFDQIEEFSRRLSDEDLQKMIDLVGMTELEGVQGWLRSALWGAASRSAPGRECWINSSGDSNEFTGSSGPYSDCRIR
jgi:hypothetical protein